MTHSKPKFIFSIFSRLLLVAILIFVVGNGFGQTAKPTVYFNLLFKGTGTSYSKSTNNITTGGYISGKNFRFIGDSVSATGGFSGNDIYGSIRYKTDYGNDTTISGGTISRPGPNGNTTKYFYFVKNATTAYLIVNPKYDNDADINLSGANYSTNSRGVNADLESFRTAQVLVNISYNFSNFTSCISTAASPQSFNVSGSNLTSSVTITAPTNFEVSKDAGGTGTYYSSVTLPQSGGNLSSTVVYVRLKSIATAGAYSGNIIVSATNAADQELFVSGDVYASTAMSAGGDPANSTVCAGSATTFSVTAVGANLTYQWQVYNGSNWSNISNTGIYLGANTPVLRLSNALNTSYNAYQYKCIITGSCGTVTSASATLTVNSLPAITASPSNSTVCAGTGTSFSVNATGTGITYQWQVYDGSSWSNLSNTGVYTGTTSSTLSLSSGISTSYNGYQYRCVVSGTCSPSVTSAAGILTINAAPSTPGNISGYAAICANTNQSYAISPVSGATSYTWTIPSGSWTITNGQGTSAINTISGLSGENGNITVTASNSCGTSSAASLPITVSNLPAPTPNFTISNAIQCLSGNSFTFTNLSTAASGTTLSSTVWDFGDATSSTSDSPSHSYTSANTYSVLLKVTASNSCATSVSKLVTVNPAPTGVISGTATICSGSSTTISVALTGTAPWTLVHSGSSNPVVVNSSPYTFSVSPTATTSYTISSLSDANCSASAGNISGTATVTVNANNPASVSIVSTDADNSICSGTSVTFTATPANGGASPTYQWLKNGIDISGATSSTYTSITSGSDALKDNDKISVILTSNYATCLINSPATSNEISIEVHPAAPATPAIITGTQTQCAGLANQTYSITDVLNATSYTWTVPTGSWTITSGQGTTSIKTTTGAATQDGQITVTASNGCGTSSPQFLDVTVVSTSNTISLSSGVGTNNQTACINSPITNITYSTSGATNASATGLPSGLSGNYTTNAFNITGTPSVSGTFNYTILLSGGSCNANTTGTITVNPLNTATLSSAAGTDAQTVCVNTPIVNITYSTTGATGASYSGLPAGVIGSFSANTITLSGTPTATGTFTYIVTLTGGCGTITKTGTLTVNPVNTITLSSAAGTDAQSKCINTSITNITYSTTGATGASIVGLPSGVTGNWSGNVITISGTPTGSGTFNYTITLTGGCSIVTKTGSITVSSSIPAAPTGSATQSFCSGNNPTIANLTATGTSIIWYSASTGGSTYSSSVALTNGSHYFASQTSGGCESSSRLDVLVAITTSSAASVSITSSDADNSICTGTSITFTANATNGGITPTYQWKLGGVDISGETNTTYTTTSLVNNSAISVVMTSNAECASGSPATSNTITTTVNLIGSISATVSNPTCSVSTGTISVTSGISGLSFTLDNGYSPITNNTGIFNSLNSGTYSLTATNAAGCTSEVKSLTIGAVPPASNTPTASVTDPTCTISTGTISITSALSGYSFSIDGSTYSNTIGVFTNIASGNYSLTAKNSSGCISPALSIMVNTQPVTSTPTAISGSTSICEGGNTTLTSSGTWSATSWTSGTPSVATIDALGVVTGLTAGTSIITYTITNTSGCSSSTTKTITVNALPTATISYSGTPFCATGTASVSLVGQTGGTYTSTTGLDINTSNGSINLSNSTPGTYTVTYNFTNGTCINSASTSITVNALPTISAISGTTTICEGATSSLTNSTSGGTWTSSNTSIATIGSNGVVTGVADGTATISYNLIGANGCTNSVTALITVNGKPAINILSVPDITNTETSFKIEFDHSSNSPSNFSLTASTRIYPGTFSTTGSFLSTSSPIIVNISGTYTGAYDFNLTVSNSLGCSSNPYNFPLRISDVDAGHIGFEEGGTYLHEKNVCQTNSLIFIGNEAPATAGATYKWQYSTASSALTESYNDFTTNATSSTYTLTAGSITQTTHFRRVATISPTSANSNVITLVVNEIPIAPSATITDPTCTISTGTISVTSVTNGLTFNLDYAFGTYTNTTGVFSNLSSGTYSLTATSDHGCVSGISPLAIGAVPAIVSTPTATVNDPTCSVSTGTISVTSGTSGLIFTLDGNGNTFTNTTGVFSSLSSGTYSLTAINTSGCVSAALTKIIGAVPASVSTPSATVIDPTCSVSSGTISVTSGTSGLTFTLNGNGNTYTNTTGVFNSLISSTYNLTATNSDGCVSSGISLLVHTQPATPSIPSVSITDPTCTVSTGIISITSSTSGLTFNLENNSGTISNTTGIFSNLSSGTYSLTASDNTNGCVSSGISLLILSPPTVPPIPTITVINICGNSTLNTSATGTLLWSTGETTSSISVLNAGTYTLTQTVGSCTSGVASVTATPLIITSESIGTIAQVNNTATSFTIPYTVLTGTPTQYSIVASTPAMSGFSTIAYTSLPVSPITVSIPASTANTYGFTISFKTADGCTSSNNINLTVIDPSIGVSTITVTGTTTYTYNGSAQGPTTSTVTGSTGVVTYSYVGTGTTNYGPSATLPTTPGTYEVIATVATDANYNGASSAAYAFTINKAASTIVATGTTTYTYNGSAQGPATSTVTGSTGAVIYSYSGTGTTTYGPSAIPPSNAGAYQVIATVAADANYNGASSPAYVFMINEPVVLDPQASLSAYYPTLLEKDSVKIKLDIENGVAPYTVIISNTTYNKLDTVNNVTNGQVIKLSPVNNKTLYNLVAVTDADGRTRTFGFTKERDSVRILRPQIALTLNADPPIKVLDNSFKLKIIMKIKNEGELDLNNVQVDANLSGVFPLGMIYKLDSVKVVYGNLLLNPNYTGLGSKTTTSNSIKVISNVKATAVIAGNYLFSNGVKLNIGEDGQVDFYFSIAETDIVTPLKLQFNSSGSGTLNQSDYTTSAQATTAISHDASSPDLNPSDPLPTIVPLFPIERVGVSLQGSTATQVNGGFVYHMIAKVKNFSNMNLDSVSLVHDFAKSFTTPDSAFIINTPVVNGFMIYNTAFNGYNNKSLITLEGTLAYQDSAQISYDLFVKTTKTKNTWLNFIEAEASSTISHNRFNDTSTNGLNPDPNGDNNPIEIVLTPLFVNATIPDPPTVLNGNYIYQSPIIPTTLRSLVVSYPINSVPVWCNTITAKCDTAAPKMPVAIGKYIYQLKSYDTTSYLYSNLTTYDTVTIRPPVPIVIDSTYIIALSTNPANIAVQYSILSSATPNFYLSSMNTNVIPGLPNIAGVYAYKMSQVVNSIESDTVSFKVTMLNLNDVIHLQKIVDSGILQSNSTFNYPFAFLVSNLTKYTFSNVVITDNLQNSVPNTSEFSIIKNTTTGGLQANTSYNGSSIVEITTSASTLAGNDQNSASFIMNLNPKGFTGTLSNIAYVTAITKWGKVTMQSSSDSRVNEKAKTPTTYFVKDLKIYIPEGFSPNHDGVHDTFVIIRPSGIRLYLEIFNRWGNQVYTNDNYQNDWDGRGTGNFAGEELVNGGYYYSLRAVDESGKTQNFKGSIILQR